MIAALTLLVFLAQAAQPTTADGWTTAGWRALRAGATEEAAADFAQALRLNGASPLALLGAGSAANLRGRTDEARLHLTRALREQPSLTAASLLLGEILYRAADLNGAIGIYEQALLRAPGDARLSARLDAWRREAAVHDTFSTRIATHFNILFEGPADQPMAARVSDMLEAIYWQVGGAIGAYPKDILTVVLYSKEQFRDVTQSPSWAGGLYDGRIRVPVAGRVDEKTLGRVLAHEFTHAVVYSVAPRGVPQWLNEGLAILMERGGAAPPPVPAKPAEPAEPAKPAEPTEPAKPAEPTEPAKGDVPSLSKLEGSFARLSPEDARTAYATSGAAAQALLDRAGPMVINNLLANLGNGMKFEDAFERAALMPYSAFKDTWR